MKYTRMLMALCLAAAMLLCVGCDEKPSEPAGENDAVAAAAWDGDLTNHWKVGDDGTETDKAAHTLDEGGMCTVCNANVVDYGDGSGAITVVNEYGDTVIFRSYATDGTVEWESKSDITYDEKGRRASETVYNDGRLQQETVYQYGVNDDELFALSEIYYNEDGSKEESTFDEVGNVESIAYFDADGTKTKTETYEYEYTEDGQIASEKVYEDGTLTFDRGYTPDADGWYYMSSETVYNADGTVDSTTYFDAMGEIVDAPAA